MIKLTKKIRWLLGMSLAAFLVVACLPLTRPYVAGILHQDFIGPFVGLANMVDRDKAQRRYVAEHANDYEVQVAGYPAGAITYPGPDLILQEIMHPDENNDIEVTLFAAEDKLIRQFPNNAAVLANVMENECDWLPKAEWRGEDIRSSGEKNPSDLPAPIGQELSFINRFIVQAKLGEKLDPQNAYFPYMLARAYYAEHKDDLAQATLLQGSGCTEAKDCVVRKLPECA
jgi:hypothetical protein